MPEPRRFLTPAQQADVLQAVVDAEQWRLDQKNKPTPNGHTPKAPETIRAYTPAELLEFPEPTWLVEPFITDGAITILYGASGTFKSFVALSWASQAPGLAIYISAEGSPKRMGERIHAIESLGVTSNILTIPHAVNLLHEADIFQNTLDAIPTPPRLIVIDTASRNMAGHDENSTKDMTSLIGVVDQIRARYQVSVVIIHHSGHENTDRERGSSALRGAADISVHAKRGDQPLTVKLRCAKSRDTAEFDPCLIRLEPIHQTLVATKHITTSEAHDPEVKAYLEQHPDASQNEVCKAITGTATDVRASYQRVRRSVSRHADTPQGSVSSGTPLPLKGEGAATHPHFYQGATDP